MTSVNYSVRSMLVGFMVLLIAMSGIMWAYRYYRTLESSVVISRISAGLNTERFVIRGNFPPSDLAVRVELDNVVYGRLVLSAHESHTCYFELTSVDDDFKKDHIRFVLADWKGEVTDAISLDGVFYGESTMFNTMFRSENETKVYHTVMRKEYFGDTLERTLTLVIDKAN